MFPEDGFRNNGRKRGSAGQSRRLPGTAPDPLDTGAGIGAPGTIAADLGLFGDHRAVRGCRRCMERGKPLQNVLSGDTGDRPAPAPGQGQIPAEPGIDRPCARFPVPPVPVPPVTPEDLLGHCPERDIAGSGSRLFTPGMDPACVRARFCKAMSSASRMSSGLSAWLECVDPALREATCRHVSLSLSHGAPGIRETSCFSM